MTREGLATIVEAVAARHGARVFRSARFPAGGAEIPTFLSYVLEKRLTKHPGGVRQGRDRRRGGSRGRQQRVGDRVLVPLLTLGLPTSATAAIMLAAFQQYGLQPGPLLFANAADCWSGA